MRRWGVLAVLTAALLVGPAGGEASAATLFFDDFEDGNASGWTTSGGSWSVLAGAYRQSSTSARAVARSGATWWEDYTLVARVRPLAAPGPDRAVGVLARVRTSTTYYSLVLRTSGRVELARTVSSSTTVLASAPMPVSLGTWYDVTLRVFGDSLAGTVGGVSVAATDATIPYGRIGLTAQYLSAEFDGVLVDDTPPTEPDRQPPSTPARPTLAELTPTTATLRWPPAVDNVGVTDYVVVQGYQFSSQDVRVLVTGTEVTLPLSPTAGNQHFSVAARDAAGNVSPLSARLVVAQPPTFPRTGDDTSSPTAPGTPFVSGTAAGGFQISWAPATDNLGVLEYHVYHAYDVDTVTVAAKVSGTTATVQFRSFPNAFWIIAYDASWNSARSPSAMLTPPAPQ